ncbi:MAG: hypothetical protein Ta2D_09060 [Rickettsiales bacterium]|nr:MAG: hypothetical protein Ta2D_09060 [Rickettsiales bacterium]
MKYILLLVSILYCNNLFAINSFCKENAEVCPYTNKDECDICLKEEQQITSLTEEQPIKEKSLYYQKIFTPYMAINIEYTFNLEHPEFKEIYNLFSLFGRKPNTLKPTLELGGILRLSDGFGINFAGIYNIIPIRNNWDETVEQRPGIHYKYQDSYTKGKFTLKGGISFLSEDSIWNINAVYYFGGKYRMDMEYTCDDETDYNCPYFTSIYQICNDETDYNCPISSRDFHYEEKMDGFGIEVSNYSKLYKDWYWKKLVEVQVIKPNMEEINKYCDWHSCDMYYVGGLYINISVGVIKFF